MCHDCAALWHYPEGSAGDLAVAAVLTKHISAFYVFASIYTWRWWSHRRVLQRRLRAAHRIALALWRGRVSAQLATDISQNDTRGGWYYSRLLAGTGLRAYKRWFSACRATLPTIRDWRDHLLLPGAKGGQSACVVWSGPSWAAISLSYRMVKSFFFPLVNVLPMPIEF